MSELPIFYSSVAVLDRARDKDRRVVDGSRAVDFARNTHVIPAVVDEFFAACRDLPIVFLLKDGVASPVFAVGIEAGKNAYIDAQGRWTARHVPAYLRRYPFILGDVEGQQSVVCLDGGHEVEPAKGERLFNDEGENTPYLDSAIAFVNSFADAAKRSDALCRKLVELDLLRSINVEVRPRNLPPTVMEGYFAVDEGKLNALSNDVFCSLRDEGAVPQIYAHLFSLGAFSVLGDKAADQAGETAVSEGSRPTKKA